MRRNKNAIYFNLSLIKRISACNEFCQTNKIIIRMKMCGMSDNVMLY